MGTDQSVDVRFDIVEGGSSTPSEAALFLSERVTMRAAELEPRVRVEGLGRGSVRGSQGSW